MSGVWSCCGSFALALAMVAVAACKGSENQSQPGGAAAQSNAVIERTGDQIRIPAGSPLLKALQVAAVEERSIESPIVVPGVVEADPARLVKIIPPASGRIVRLDKHLGDEVKRNDALFVLDSADVALAVADAGKADAAQNLARRNLDRQKELTAAEIAARKDLEQAESDFALAESESRRAHARLAQLGVSAQEQTGRLHSLRSPITGTVIDLTAAEGGFWNDTNAPIMTVADLSTVWVAASVPEKDLASVFVDQDAVITLNAYSGEFIRGKVRYLGKVLDPDTRTVKARIVISNTNGRFRPGMFAKVIFHGQAHRAPAVPLTALVQSGFDTRVFVEVSPDVFQPRVVRVGARMDDNVEILSGLKVGERVVVKEGVLLND